MKRLQRFAGRLAAAAALLAAGGLFGELRAASAATVAGTVITNTSTASYSDASANAYNATSNTVSVTVQNAPSMSVTAGSNKTVAPGQTVTDTFSVTNTGNAAGIVALTAAATIGGSDSGSTTVTYSYNSASYSTYTALNTALASVSVATSASINIGVVYALASTAAVGDVQTNISGTITYAANGNATAQTSTAATAAANEVDSVLQDAILDVALASVNNAGTITYTVKAADRTTTWGAKDLSSVGTLLGLSSSGVLISAKIPQFPAGTPLTIAGTPAVTTSTANGFGTGSTATIYSTASTTGASGWTVGMVTNAYYIGVYVTGGTCTNGGASTAGIEFCPPGAQTSSAGTVPNPAVTLTFAVTQSSSSGSANTGSTTAIANSLIGDNASTEHVIAPSITLNTLLNSAATAATLTATGQGVNNATAPSATSYGASNIDSNQSTVSYLFYNGPFANALATGSVDGSSNDNSHDFTAVSFSSSANYVTTDTAATYSPTTVSTTTSSNTVKVENTITNSGNKDDTYTIVAGTLPSGWTVALQTDTGTAGTTTPGAASGIALGSATAGTSSTATAVSVASGSTLNYWAVYTIPSGVTYLSHQNVGLVATSGLSSTTNTTYNLLYAGFVAITTIATTTSSGCPTNVTNPAGTICPTGTIQYTIAYRNIVGGSSNWDTSSVPAVSFAGVSTKAGTFYLTADGATSANWATYTNGPTAAPVDTTANTTYVYTPGGTSTLTPPVTKFVAQVGGATFQLVPYGYAAAGAGSYGQITYSVTVK